MQSNMAEMRELRNIALIQTIPERIELKMIYGSNG